MLHLNDDKSRKGGLCKGTPAPGLNGASELRLPLAAEHCQRTFVNALATLRFVVRMGIFRCCRKARGCVFRLQFSNFLALFCAV